MQKATEPIGESDIHYLVVNFSFRIGNYNLRRRLTSENLGPIRRHPLESYADS